MQEKVFAKKVSRCYILLKSEARMLNHATQQAGIKGPKLKNVYFNGIFRVMITYFNTGVSLHKI